jgi:hypothetical protein
VLVGILMAACTLCGTESTGAQAVAARQSTTSPVRIQLTVTRVAGGTSAECVLTLDGRDSVEVFTSDLPWASDDSTTWVAVQPGRTPLEQTLPVEDPGSDTTVIKPGAVLRGRVDLARQFESLQAKSSTGEVVVFWTYRLRTVDGRTSNRVGGWLSMR